MIQETKMKIQEASEDLQMGGIMFPKYQGKLFEDEDLKPTENRGMGPEERHHVPRAFEKCLGHNLAIQASRACTMRLGHENCFTLIRLVLFLSTSCMQKVGAQLSFPASVLGKVRTFSPNPGRNSHYKYQPSSFRISRSEL
jgi:hypothetical protein